MAVYFSAKATPIILSTQLADGEESLPKVVKATIRNALGTVLEAGLILNHVGGGLFILHGQSMPDEDQITVQYQVYDEDGVTLDTEYEIGTDAFVQPNESTGIGAPVVIYDEYIVEVDDE